MDEEVNWIVSPQFAAVQSSFVPYVEVQFRFVPYVGVQF